MSENKFGMPYDKIDEVRTVNPETAAHNIALAYVQSTFCANNSNEAAVEASSVINLTRTYIDVYNYAYNCITHENDCLNQVE